MFAAWAIAMWSMHASPNDPSAGAVGIVVIFTAPMGFFGGLALGTLLAAKWPRVFLATLPPLAVCLLGYVSFALTLRQMDRPRDFVLKLTGTPGAAFTGFIEVDGVHFDQVGQLPREFAYQGQQLRMKFALVQPAEGDVIAMNVFANGHDKRTGHESSPGFSMEVEAQGYSETFGGIAAHWSLMTPDEADQFIANQPGP